MSARASGNGELRLAKRPREDGPASGIRMTMGHRHDKCPGGFAMGGCLGGCCDCDKGVVPNETARTRSSTLIWLAGLQVLFGASRLISGLTGTREIVLGGLAYVAVSSQDRHLINLVWWHAFLCAIALADEITRASFWFYHFGRDPTTEVFHGQTACLYLIATYYSMTMYQILRECAGVSSTGGTYTVLADGKDS
ncbi:hypothetical protein AAMO2058_001155800 [Amorphochlora amoebiformis]